FHTGAITRVAMHNFLTYADVNFKPGPKLNIVMGPNGAGKSSIVCAMVLGLAGNPKFLGRSENLNDFIMHEQQHAWVEVELEVHEVGKRVVFRRSFERNVKGSKWQLDGRTHPEKHVKEKIAALGIQVDNLCTFLPQDRVGDFSGYNPQ
ncbi:P-loop containing nucleoside triphosphate hydrolase protein, partial [Tribonema minus]